jgi:hypothetical protein
LPKTTIPEKWLSTTNTEVKPTNTEVIRRRFEIIEDNEREIAERAQRDSAEKTSENGLDATERRVQRITCFFEALK